MVKKLKIEPLSEKHAQQLCKRLNESFLSEAVSKSPFLLFFRIVPCKDPEYGDFLVYFNSSSWESSKHGKEVGEEDYLIFRGHIGKAINEVPRIAYSFGYIVSHPGVRYYADGSGEPPSEDFVESKENFNNIGTVVHAVVSHYLKGFIYENLEGLFEDWELEKEGIHEHNALTPHRLAMPVFP